MVCVSAPFSSFSCASFLFFPFLPHSLFHSTQEFYFSKNYIMQNHNALKKEILKKWLKGLQICSNNSSSSKEKMSLLERKKAIKLSADLAMASSTTRNGKRSSYYWSRALINKASKDSETAILAKQILQGNKNNATFSSSNPKRRNICSNTSIINKFSSTSRKKISKFRKVCPKKSIGASNLSNKCYYKERARSMAKKLVKKRTEILKGLIPGGEFFDDYSLVKETLDYIVSLRAQVDVMHHLANSPQFKWGN